MSDESPSVVRVSEDRWRQAQAWEAGVWDEVARGRGWRRWVKPWLHPILVTLGLRRNTGDDWNGWWREKFENYRALPQQLDNLVELGCGPYTNTRLVLEGRVVRHVHCSDPLASRYVTLPRSWLAEQHRAGRILMDDHPAEECPYRDDFFDVCILINVLDHVRDADECLRNATRIVKPGGFFIFGQEFSDAADVAKHGDDIGHPIRLQPSDVEPHLAGFEPVIHQVLTREQGRAPDAHCGTLLFLGRKKPVA